MTDSETAESLRVAIVGSGPAGFYAADFLLKSARPEFEVDLFERFPTPFGLVRFGVAPDHQNIKRVTAAFERTAKSPRFRFLGNVEVGRSVSVEELRRSYDQVLFACGSASDRKLGIDGESLEGSYAATSFVGWYNGHPDYRSQQFRLDSERAVVVGMGNVALDVARVLVRDRAELAATDIAAYALESLEKSLIRQVVLLGRRGPAQAAFDQGELESIADLDGVGVYLDEGLDRALLEPSHELSAAARKNVEYLRTLPVVSTAKEPRRVILRFLASPVALLGDGRVERVRVEQNRLEPDGKGGFSAVGAGDFDEIEAGLVLRSIGYRGIPMPGVPFDERGGVIPNRDGRVLEAPGGAVIPGLYAVGWIKRGPTGLIGTNKSDAKQTVSLMLEDAASRRSRRKADAPVVDALLAARGLRVVTLDDWHRLDALETEHGKLRGKVREKFYAIEDMLAKL